MLFAITIACSNETITFENASVSPKQNTNQGDNNQDDNNQDDNPSYDTGNSADSGLTDNQDDGIIDLDDVMDIFNTYSCQGCHGSSGGFRLNTSELKNGTSTATGLPYLVSGQPQQSYLYLKIADTGGISGQAMPIGGVGLMQTEDVEIVRQWIADGALGL